MQVCMIEQELKHPVRLVATVDTHQRQVVVHEMGVLEILTMQEKKTKT